MKMVTYLLDRDGNVHLARSRSRARTSRTMSRRSGTRSSKEARITDRQIPMLLEDCLARETPGKRAG